MNGGSTMTINGKLEVASLQETVTVTSQAPTIDLEVVESRGQLGSAEARRHPVQPQPHGPDLAGARSLCHVVRRRRSSFGTGSGPAARTFGRTGGNVVMYDGMMWDQTYGDYGTFEEAQITTAAKGADAMNPGLTMNLVIKSGGNTFRGSAWRTTRTATCRARTSSQELLDRATRRAPTSSPRCKRLLRRNRRSDPEGQAVVLRQLSRRPHRQLHPRLRAAVRPLSRWSSSPSCENPTGKVTWQVSKSNKFEGMIQVGRKWQPYRTREPFRAARGDAEPGLVFDDRALVQVASIVIGSRATLDASVQRGGY